MRADRKDRNTSLEVRAQPRVGQNNQDEHMAKTHVGSGESSEIQVPQLVRIWAGSVGRNPRAVQISRFSAWGEGISSKTYVPLSVLSLLNYILLHSDFTQDLRQHLAIDYD